MRARRVLVSLAPIAGLVVLVGVVELVIVLGIGNIPTADQRPLLVASAFAAGVTALLYLPLRERLAGAARETLLGPRRSPEEVLQAFGGRLTRPLPLDELLQQLVESLRGTMALERAELWTGSAGVLERVASDPAAKPATLVLTPEEEAVVAAAGVSGGAWAATWLPSLGPDRPPAELRVAPATYAGELLGLVLVQRAAGSEPFHDDDADTLLTLARHVGLALHNVRLGSALESSLRELRRQADELRASRARVVASADAERRRIERDLHDGAQSPLYSIALKVRLARELAAGDPDRARAVLEGLSGEIERVLEQFRDLARGIYPSVLVDHGLAEGLRTATACAPLPARAEKLPPDRYAGEVEATVYFCCLEALQNAGRHGGDGAHAAVRVWEEDGRLRFTVADDGVGFDAAAPRDGGSAGIDNMRDRVGALGGALTVRSAPGQGTTVEGWIPAQSRDSAR